MRYAAKIDTAQRDIVKDLRACGYIVEHIREPVDLLVRAKTWPSNIWVTLECKTKNRKDGYAPDKRQQAQIEFCAVNGVPYVFETEGALAYLATVGKRLGQSNF